MANEQTLEDLKRERDRFVLFAFASADILIETDEHGMIHFMDGATSGLLGHSAETLCGTSFFDMIGPEDVSRIRGQLRQTDKPVRLDSVPVQLRSATHGSLPFAISGFKLSHLRNHYYLTLSLIKRDIPMEELAARDVYSGLMQKDTFAVSATRKIRVASESGQELSMTLLDFPELKQFLDGLPDVQAHALMGEISNYLRSKSVDGDTAGLITPSAYSFVHDPSVTKEEVIKDLINITRRADPTGIGLEMRAQTFQPDPSNLEEQDFGTALLVTINKFAAETGENFNLNTLSDGYQTVLEDTVERINDFRRIVSCSEFEVAFQPIVDLRSGLIHHFETLVRLNDSSKFENPFKFITFGEQAGLISEFDLAMAQKTFEIVHEMHTQGHNPLVALNLSGKSLSSPQFMNAMRALMDQNIKLRKQIIFEVTESAKIADMKEANRFIQEMRSAGNLCCLDDFGVGESGFDYLRSLQVDFVKVDGSYVKESLATPRGRHLLRAMISLCRDLGITTIGEMVEDDKTVALLWDTGVQFGQGYYFGKPTTDRQTLVNPSRTTPHYKGITRARKFLKLDQKWWKRSGKA